MPLPPTLLASPRNIRYSSELTVTPKVCIRFTLLLYNPIVVKSLRYCLNSGLNWYEELMLQVLLR